MDWALPPVREDALLGAVFTVVGSINLDRVASVARLPVPGETLAARGYAQSAGGKGANQAAALARLGGPCTLIGAVGADESGNWLIQQLAATGVRTDAIRRIAGVPTGTALILTEDTGRNQIVVVDGANARLTVDDVHRNAGLIRASRAVVAQLETPWEPTEAAFALARECGVMTVLNAAPARQLATDQLRWCDWLVVNETEAGVLGKGVVEGPDSAASVARELRARAGRVGVIVTLGARGAWVQADEGGFHQPVLAVTVVDTVGAGDAFVGAFVAGLAEGMKPREAAGFAVAGAALAVTRPGALSSIPFRSEVDSFLARSSRAVPG